MNKQVLSQEQYDAFWSDGYLLLRSFFTSDEISKLQDTARRDEDMKAHAVVRADSEGSTSRLALWQHPGDDLYGIFARCDSMVGMAQQLLGDEPYHYHSKMMMKEPHGGGAWEWHQDYGYWYQNGVLKPDLCSVMIAVDAATRENGCLQVIRGSHTIGRIDHHLTGDQAGADMTRVNVALERMELVYCEMEPGDVLAFHCNTLHRSDANRSDHPRWSMISCYNTRSNDPFQESHHPRYTPIHVVPRRAILDFSANKSGSTDRKEWLEAASDRSAASLADRD